jgi:hypothetical protein
MIPVLEREREFMPVIGFASSTFYILDETCPDILFAFPLQLCKNIKVHRSIVQPMHQMPLLMPPLFRCICALHFTCKPCQRVTDVNVIVYEERIGWAHNEYSECPWFDCTIILANEYGYNILYYSWNLKFSRWRKSCVMTPCSFVYRYQIFSTATRRVDSASGATTWTTIS